MTIRFGVIGAGAWGLNHIRSILDEPACDLVAVADPNAGAIDQVRLLAPAVALAPDPDRLIANPEIDALVIASPSPTHGALARTALLAGKHVLVEKPLAMSVPAAREIVSAARESGRVAMVGHLMIFHPAVRKLRELLRTGVLGALHYVHSTRVNLGRLRSDENVLWSFGPHDLSMLDFLLEKMPVSVSARGQSVLQRGVEDLVFLSLRYETGEMAHVHLSWLSPRKERRLTIVGSKKMVEFDDTSSDMLRIYDKGYDAPATFTQYAEFLTLRDGDVTIPQIPMEEPLRAQLREFLDCIHTRQPSLADAESGLRVVSILAAAQQSLAEDGAPVALLT